MSKDLYVTAVENAKIPASTMAIAKRLRERNVGLFFGTVQIKAAVAAGPIGPVKPSENARSNRSIAIMPANARVYNRMYDSSVESSVDRTSAVVANCVIGRCLRSGNVRRHRAGRVKFSISNSAASPAPCARHGYPPFADAASEQSVEMKLRVSSIS